MSTTIKKSKIKKPSEIKTEKIELQPLGAYVSDRVELIRQVFSCLKNKYIKSICPEVLAGRSIQEIQECCLDELLGISKKRLLAILNATKCPSDTDSSSDNGSDRDSEKEYISLEEISSDDEMHEKGMANTDNKEISVLELLELQARARAIRSQLALEPVTKIELDSEKEDESNSSTTSSTSKVNDKPKTGKSKKKNKRPTHIEKMLAELDNNDEAEVTSTMRLAQQPQPIRLKRNFLKRENRPSATICDDIKDETKPNSEALPKIGESTNKIEIDSKLQIEKIDEGGCSSPDIITVVQSPETYSITDSEDDNEQEKNDGKEMATNDKKSVIKISQESNENNDELPEEGEIIEERVTDREIIVISENAKDGESKKVENSVEKCAISETEERPNRNLVESKEFAIELPTHQNDSELNVVEPNLTVDLADEELDYELKDDSEGESGNEDKKVENAESETIEIFESSDEEIGQIHVNTITIPIIESITEVEDNDCQSFHERWLGSKKVSKILATSRLGNRLRGNIKSKKAAERAQYLESPTSEQVTEKPFDLILEPVDYDVDSVEHYKNLVSNAEKSELIEKIGESKEHDANTAKIEENEKKLLVVDESSG